MIVGLIFLSVAVLLIFLLPGSLAACGSGWRFDCFGCQDGEDGQDGQDGANGANGKNGVNGQDGIDGKNGSNGRDVIRMFSENGLEWRYNSYPTDHYMLETNIYNGQVTHIIFEIEFMKEQVDGSLVFMAK